MSARRIRKELLELNEQNAVNCSAGPVGDDITEWAGIIIGPEGTPYQGGVFALKIAFPHDYPFKPPRVKFDTRIYHCNVSASGYICLDVLKDKWSPVLTITKVLLSICSLLNDPNPDDPLRPEIAREFLEKRVIHDEKARIMTTRYAGGPYLEEEEAVVEAMEAAEAAGREAEVGETD